MNRGNKREDEMEVARKKGEIDEGKGGYACESGSNPTNLRHREQRDDTVMTPFLNRRRSTIRTSFRSLPPAKIYEDANYPPPPSFRWAQNNMQ